jgi:hypothetical protein
MIQLKKNIFNTKCFGLCGCDENDKCTNCNAPYFLGYVNPKEVQSLFPNSLISQAPGTSQLQNR